MREFYPLKNNVMEEDKVKELEQENDELRKTIWELEERIDLLEGEIDDLESDNSSLKIAIDNSPDLEEVLDATVRAVEWRFRWHPNPDVLTLDLVIGEIKDTIQSFNS